MADRNIFDTYKKAVLTPGSRFRVFDWYQRESRDPDDRMSCDGCTGTINYLLRVPSDRGAFRDRHGTFHAVYNVTLDNETGERTNIALTYLIPIGQ